MFYPVKIPSIFPRLFSNYIWSLEEKKCIYLTFDDGPIPGVTEWILDILKEYNAQATFFALGNNVEQHPAIYQRIIDEGHAVGNHTYDHKNGWNTSLEDYEESVKRGEGFISSSLFRPPYGKIRLRQAKMVERLGYKVVMWSLMPGDFDVNLSNEKCWTNVETNMHDGAVIVLHDSLKAEEKVRYVLPRILKKYKEQGYTFKKIAL